MYNIKYEVKNMKLNLFKLLDIILNETFCRIFTTLVMVVYCFKVQSTYSVCLLIIYLIGLVLLYLNKYRLNKK